MLRFAALFLLCLVAGAAAAQSQTPLWRGTLGKAAVVVELDPAAQAPNGRYFYARYLRDIALEGERSETSLRLSEPAEEGAPVAKWVLDTAKAGELNGEWVGADGWRLPIHLTRFDPAKEHDPDRAQLLRDYPYEYLRSEKLRLEAGVLETVGNYRLQWFEEPHTQVSLFQVVSGYPEAARQRINRALRERHWQEISAAMGCVAESNGEYDSTTTLRRIDATKNAVSVSPPMRGGSPLPSHSTSSSASTRPVRGSRLTGLSPKSGCAPPQ